VSGDRRDATITIASVGVGIVVLLLLLLLQWLYALKYLSCLRTPNKIARFRECSSQLPERRKRFLCPLLKVAYRPN
jgi:hypothetical protein